MALGTIDLTLYARLAKVFDVPGAGFAEEIAEVAAALDGTHPAAADAVRRLAALAPSDPTARAELFLRTFDVQPITTLDLGYVLFGEDYKRGALLAGLSAEHTRAGNACGLELGDHLPNVLRLLPRITDPEVREELVSVIVAPAVRQMLQEFEPDRILAKEEVYRKHHKTIIEHAADETRTAYRHAFEALDHMLRADFRLASAPPPEPITTFERRIDAEIDLESGTSCSPA
ncbi:MAG: hypothetical protein IPK07_20415 [Deltaproteobacteria bacterium]|nr:hypothetical protein [Deltaproteobacteria bacterium]